MTDRFSGSCLYVAAEPIDRPGHDDIEPPLGRVPAWTAANCSEVGARAMEIPQVFCGEMQVKSKEMAKIRAAAAERAIRDASVRRSDYLG